MELVIDANIAFSLFKVSSLPKVLIDKYSLELFSPDKLIEEMDKYADLICSKSKAPKDSYGIIKQSVLELISVHPVSKELVDRAAALLNDKDDAPYLALAIKLGLIPIWSNDRHLKAQSLVKVFTTVELSKFLSSE